MHMLFTDLITLKYMAGNHGNLDRNTNEKYGSITTVLQQRAMYDKHFFQHRDMRNWIRAVRNKFG